VHLVRLIDDHHIDFGALATSDRLHAAHLDRLVAIGALVDALHNAEAVNALGLERGDGLVNQAKSGNREGEALSFVERALDDVCCSQRLAEPGGRLKQGASLAGRQGTAQRDDSGFLVKSERTQAHADTCRCFFSSPNFLAAVLAPSTTRRR